jgi:hypothetical protein
MGFGGGGTGSFSLPDHEHTDTLQDGGALVGNTSLVDSETLDTYVASEVATLKPVPSISTDQNTTGDQTINSSSFVDLNDMSITLPNNTGSSMVIAVIRWYSSTLGASGRMTWEDDGTPVGVEQDPHALKAGSAIITTLCRVFANDGSVITVAGKWGSSQSWVFTTPTSTIYSLEVNG